MNPAAIPTQLVDIVGDRRWITQHERFVQECKQSNSNVLLIGDSLIQNMQNSIVWQENFEPLNCLNFGIGGDQTQHVLWRIMNGELDFQNPPKIVVLLVGTNNIDHTADQIADGIIQIVIEIRNKLPETHLIVQAIPPRGRDINIVREKIIRINQLIEQNLHKQTNFDNFIHYIGSNEVLNFISPQDGTINHKDMHDYLHFTNQGYTKFTQPLLNKIAKILSIKM